MIALLGRAPFTQPEAKAGLMGWLSRESEMELVQLGGRYLSLAEMRGVRARH